MKKGMAMNYIVTAAILLIIFILIVVFVSNKFGIFGQSQTCKAKNGNCKPVCSEDEIKLFTADCGKNGEKSGSCCFPKSEVGF